MINFFSLFQRAPLSNITKEEFDSYQVVLFRKLEAVEHNILSLGDLLERQEREEKEENLERSAARSMMTTPQFELANKDDDEDEDEEEEREKKQFLDFGSFLPAIAGAVGGAITTWLNPSNENSPLNFFHRLFGGKPEEEQETKETTSSTTSTQRMDSSQRVDSVQNNSSSSSVMENSTEEFSETPELLGGPEAPAPAPTPETPKKRPKNNAVRNSAGSQKSPLNLIRSGAPLGSLAASEESGKKGSMAIGYDPKGGTSYGKYQIASNTGTFDKFIEFLEERGAKDIVARLTSGPANTGGTTGTVPTEWKKLVQENKIQKYEHEFIKMTHFDRALNLIREKNQELATLIQKSPVLQEVLWSTAVQHGPGLQGKKSIGAAGIFLKSFTSGISEDQLIENIYNKRKTLFSSSPANIQQSVANRFDREKATAKNSLTQSSSVMIQKESMKQKISPSASVENSSSSSSGKVIAIDASSKNSKTIVSPPAAPSKKVEKKPPDLVRNPMALPPTGKTGTT
jgi:hypothetical protein